MGIGQMRKIGIQLPTGQSKTSVACVETLETATNHEFICRHQPTAPSMDGINSFFNYCEDNDCDEENNDKQAPFLRRNAVQKLIFGGIAALGISSLLWYKYGPQKQKYTIQYRV